MIEFLALPAIAPADAPFAPGWWPLPPGWWILGSIAAFVGVWLLAKLLSRLLPKRIIPPDIRTFALAALSELEHRRNAGDREVAFRLNEILRAALNESGEPGDWWPFTPRDDLDIDHEEWAAFWTELEMRYRSTAYQQNDKSRKRRWMAIARDWIERIPDQDGVRANL